MKVSTLFVAALLSGGCEKEGPKPQRNVSGPIANHHDEEEHQNLPRQLRVAPEMAREAGLETEVARRSALAATLSLPGELAPEPDRTAQLSTLVAGKLEQVSFNEGSRVKKGEVMAVLRVPDVGRLRGALRASAFKAKASRTNAERLRALKETGLGAEQAVVDAEADARAQEADAKALDEQLKAMGVSDEAGSGYWVPLRAPLSGVVVSRDALVGQPVSAEHILATVVDLSQLWFLGRVFEKDLNQLRAGARSEVRLNAFPGESFEGTVEHVGQQTDPVARTLTARIRLNNSSARLRLGLFGIAHVEIIEPGQVPTHLVVPRGAIVDIGDKHLVFVRSKDGDFVVHEVTLGEGALARVQVLSGLDEGEEVVTQGVFTLKSLLLKSSLAEGSH